MRHAVTYYVPRPCCNFCCKDPEELTRRCKECQVTINIEKVYILLREGFQKKICSYLDIVEMALTSRLCLFDTQTFNTLIQSTMTLLGHPRREASTGVPVILYVPVVVVVSIV